MKLLRPTPPAIDSIHWSVCRCCSSLWPTPRQALECCVRTSEPFEPDRKEAPMHIRTGIRAGTDDSVMYAE